MEIRPERATDAAAIAAVTTSAFHGAAHSSGSEARIIERLRTAGALTVSLVAVEKGEIVGHVAGSPVTIPGAGGAWYGLGPVSVRPDRQGLGLGQALVRAALHQLRSLGAAGCAVLGEPAYYCRFGFESDPAVFYAGAPFPYLQRLVLNGPPATGEVFFHPAFDA